MFLKSKKIKVECVTNDLGVSSYMPIVHNKKIIPDWWKKIKEQDRTDKNKSVQKPFVNSTMKSCPGLLHSFKSGFSIRTITDVEIDFNAEQQTVGFNTPDTIEGFNLSVHPPEHSGEFFPNEEYIFLKINYPWYVSTNDDISWVVTPAFWNLNHQILSNVLIPSGVTNFKNEPALKTFIAVKNTTHSIQIPMGTPICYYYPMSEKTLEVTSSYDPKKYKEMYDLDVRLSYKRSYYKKLKIKNK